MGSTASVRRFGTPVKAPAFQHSTPKTHTASVTVTRVKHAGKTNLLSAAAGMTVTLPAAIGSGARFRFVVKTTATSGDYVVKVANGTDVFRGGIHINDTGDSAAATNDFAPTASTSDTFTMGYAIGGGKMGDWVEIEDIAAGFFVVRGQMQGVTDPATPFSATVS